MSLAPPLAPVLDKKQQKKERLKAQAIASGDCYIWAYVTYPIVITVIGLFSTLLDSFPDTTIAAIGMSFLIVDRQALKHREITPPHWGWIILGLPYIWKRCNILKKSKTPFWLATMTIVIQIAAMTISLTLLTTDYKIIKEQIPSIATELLQEPGTPAPYFGATCVKLSGFKDFSDGNLSCTLDNGERIFIDILTNEKGESYVMWSPYSETSKTSTDNITSTTANKTSPPQLR
ncbi:hypothetical protein [Halodesulfovibrio sp. MK-HDV]|uniref:hypothetical protein n=1 Tax=Halodesulfovibrio sp. MK-HDV TaxID=2599925 RepID=UPI0013703FCF|nr:hypothetical protein [Halodesulfovibrio sp. MK-HDV]KAF1074314.1 hypothetical protein MKHDV_02893 [Halodesulfovibrio sp. MK-HDV]